MGDDFGCGAAELVAYALRDEQDDFAMDELLGELQMPDDLESDARIRNERDSDRINFYGSLDAQDRGVIDGRPEGLREAMTIDFDIPLRTLARAEVAKHRAVGSENLTVFDLHQKYSGPADLLPEWDINDPKTANVQRGLIAGRPDELYVIRGGFSSRDLLTMVWSQYQVTTQCGLRISVDCDPVAAAPTNRDFSQKVWGVFTVPHGDWLTYWTVCANCYLSFWHLGNEFTGFDVS